MYNITIATTFVYWYCVGIAFTLYSAIYKAQ